MTKAFSAAEWAATKAFAGEAWNDQSEESRAALAAGVVEAIKAYERAMEEESVTDHESQLEAAVQSGYMQAINDILCLRLSRKARETIAQFSATHDHRSHLDEERYELLRLDNRTTEQDARLAKIEDALISLPNLNMSRSDREAMSIIRDAAKRLRP